MAKLFLSPAVLDPAAQDVLLAEIEPVFTPEDNEMLLALPNKDEIKEVLFNSNLKAAPGTDGLTSLLYKECWDRPARDGLSRVGGGGPDRLAEDQPHGVWVKAQGAPQQEAQGQETDLPSQF